MRKRLRVVGLIGCGLLLAIAMGLFALYKGLQHEPQFYREAISIDPLIQKRASDEMLERTTALYSDVREEGQWRAIFTADQINGWLAVDLVENHSDALPKGATDPRVAIEPDRIVLACRFQQGYGNSVLSLTVEPYLPEPNVLALRICRARAGMLPVPLGEILDRISKAAGRTGLRLKWRQADGDPVVFISVSPLHDQNDKLVQINALRLDRGEIYLAGTTGRREESGSPVAARAAVPAAAKRPSGR